MTGVRVSGVRVFVRGLPSHWPRGAFGDYSGVLRGAWMRVDCRSKSGLRSSLFRGMFCDECQIGGDGLISRWPRIVVLRFGSCGVSCPRLPCTVRDWSL